MEPEVQLRRPHQSKWPNRTRGSVQVIAVTSGKGGVGKSTVSVNLSVALARRGRRVMLLDADFTLGNVGILLGLTSNYHLGHVLNGSCELKDAMVVGPGGVLVLPGASGGQDVGDLGSGHYSGLFGAFAAPPADIEVLVVDTPAGLGRNVTAFVGASQEIVVVARDEATSIADASALMQTMARAKHRDHFRLLVNMVQRPAQGHQVLEKLYKACDRLSSIHIDLMGTVPDDTCLIGAAQAGRAVSEAAPNSPSAQAFAELAEVCESWPQHAWPTGNSEFFLERLVTDGRSNNEVAA